MVCEPLPHVWVFVGERGDRAADRRFLVGAVAGLLGVAPAGLVLAQTCERCGGDHGRPIVNGVASPAPRVSLSRAGGRVAVAVTWLGAVGIDIESVSDVAAWPIDDAAFADVERAALRDLDSGHGAAARSRASIWTAKEATLKLTGDGLRRDPRELRITLPGDESGELTATAVDGVALPPSVRLELFEPAPGLVGTVAVTCSRRPVLRVIDSTQSRAAPASTGRGWE
ncbi:MAG TPA: hypothetical protein DCP11_04095 [Microbacteriaceae bacterium]|jgi:4'-phosphopantetheinyl transferase|nr:hypothetical protein [Microbacteriaceae bacterium]